MTLTVSVPMTSNTIFGKFAGFRLNHTHLLDPKPLFVCNACVWPNGYTCLLGKAYSRIAHNQGSFQRLLLLQEYL